MPLRLLMRLKSNNANERPNLTHMAGYIESRSEDQGLFCPEALSSGRTNSFFQSQRSLGCSSHTPHRTDASGLP